MNTPLHVPWFWVWNSIPKSYGTISLENTACDRNDTLFKCSWHHNNIGVIIYGFNLNISPKMSYGVLECDIVLLQNYRLTLMI